MMCETTPFGDDNLQLIDFSVEDDYLIAFPYRNSIEDLRLSVSFDNNGNGHAQAKSVDSRRQSLKRKSLAWDSAFFTNAGLLNPEELVVINKGLKKTESNQRSHKTKKDGKRCNHSSAPSCQKMSPCPPNKVNNNGPMENKTQKSVTARDPSVTKWSRLGESSGLRKSSPFTSPTTEKKSKVHSSYESSSSTASFFKNLSKSVRRKLNHNKVELVNSPSSTFSVSSSDGWLSESLCSTTIAHQKSEERKIVRQNASRSSIGTGLFSGGPKRKMKSSGLRMPSPKIGFFDEEPVYIVSPQARIKGPSLSPNGNSLNKSQSICRKSKADGPMQKENSKKKTMNSARKTQRHEVETEKENVCSFEDRVNGLSRQLEVVDLERDGIEAKGQRVHEVVKPGQRSVLATATMNVK